MTITRGQIFLRFLTGQMEHGESTGTPYADKTRAHHGLGTYSEFSRIWGVFWSKDGHRENLSCWDCNGILLDVNCWLAKALVVVGDRTRSGKWVLFFSGPAPQYFLWSWYDLIIVAWCFHAFLCRLMLTAYRPHIQCQHFGQRIYSVCVPMPYIAPCIRGNCLILCLLVLMDLTIMSPCMKLSYVFSRTKMLFTGKAWLCDNKAILTFRTGKIWHDLIIWHKYDTNK